MRVYKIQGLGSWVGGTMLLTRRRQVGSNRVHWKTKNRVARDCWFTNLSERQTVLPLVHMELSIRRGPQYRAHMLKSSF